MEAGVLYCHIVPIAFNREVHSEGLVLHAVELVMVLVLSFPLFILERRKLLQLGGSGKAEITLEIEIEDPQILGCHHEKNPFIDFDTEYDGAQIDSDSGDLLKLLLLACMGEHELLVFVEDPDAVAKNVDVQL